MFPIYMDLHMYFHTIILDFYVLSMEMPTLAMILYIALERLFGCFRSLTAIPNPNLRMIKHFSHQNISYDFALYGAICYTSFWHIREMTIGLDLSLSKNVSQSIPLQILNLNHPKESGIPRSHSKKPWFWLPMQFPSWFMCIQREYH